MPLNSSSDMPALTFVYSGVCLYLLKVSSHRVWASGGPAPMIGSHSTMGSPHRVSRVTPPSTTIAKISTQQINSQTATGLPEDWVETDIISRLAVSEDA